MSADEACPEGRYVYGVVSAIDADLLAGLRGVDGRACTVVEHRGLSAVVSAVPYGDYGDAVLRARFEDVAWLERTTGSHDHVVRALLDHGAAALVRLATVCHGDAGVRALLQTWHHVFAQVLHTVSERVEWNVRAWATEPEPAVGALRRRTPVALETRLVADMCHQRLSKGCVSSRRLPALDERVTGRAGTMVLNGAYLVPPAAGDRFEAAFRAVSAVAANLDLEIQGPRPPYSFAAVSLT